jgi:hypothetical protein
MKRDPGKSVDGRRGVVRNAKQPHACDKIARMVPHAVFIDLKTFGEARLHQAEGAQGSQRISRLDNADAKDRVLRFDLDDFNIDVLLTKGYCER